MLIYYGAAEVNISKKALREYVQGIDVVNELEQELLAIAEDPNMSLQYREGSEAQYLLSNTQYRNPAHAHVRGMPTTTVHPSDCGHCLRGAGPFTDCRIALRATGDYLFRGACTNCAWGGPEDRCQYFGGPASKLAERTGQKVTKYFFLPLGPATIAAQQARAAGAATPQTGLLRTAVRGAIAASSSGQAHTMFNFGVNTASATALERQAAAMEAQATANRLRASAIRSSGYQHVRNWSNDSTASHQAEGEEEDDEEEE